MVYAWGWTMIDESRSRQGAKDRQDAEACKQRFTDILAFFEVMNVLFNLVSKVGRSGLKPLGKKRAKLAG